MPRAFLITNRRYNSAVDYDENLPPSRESSPERRVSTAEGCDEGDSLPPHHPSSPHSPAHESRSCQHSPLTMTEPPSFRAAALVTVIRQLMQQPRSSPSPQQLHLDPCSKLQLHHDPRNSKQLHQDPCNKPDLHLDPCNKHLQNQLLHQDISPQSQQQDSHSCSECGKRYSTSSNLARHRQTHRSPTDARAARRCPSCGKVYVSAPAFAMHVRTHSQGCRCPYCGKCFSRPWLLQGHVRTHTGEKPFRCPVCAKAFADKSNLRAHVQTHSSSKPFVCARCGKAFALKSYLYKHEESSCMRVHSKKTEAPLDLATAVRVG